MRKAHYFTVQEIYQREIGGKFALVHGCFTTHSGLCGVRRICYTSFVGADDPAHITDMPFLPRDYKQTEALIIASGLEYNIQRDYLYIYNIPNFFRFLLELLWGPVAFELTRWPWCLCFS